MKINARVSILVLFLLTIAVTSAGTTANALTSGPSASGSYRFELDDNLAKSVEFTATADERGGATGEMTFRDEARISEPDLDGVGGHQGDPPSEFYLTATLNSLTVENNRAVMGGTITASSIQSYVGRWVQLVVEDNGDGRESPDKLSWRVCRPEEGGWVPADAEVRDDEGAYWRWWATDAELRDDAGIESRNIIPGNRTGCEVLPLSSYQFADVRNGEGQIQVQP